MRKLDTLVADFPDIYRLTGQYAVWEPPFQRNAGKIQRARLQVLAVQRQILFGSVKVLVSENLRNSGDGGAGNQHVPRQPAAQAMEPFPVKRLPVNPRFFTVAVKHVSYANSACHGNKRGFLTQEYFRRIRIGASIQDIVLYAFPGFRQEGEVEHAPGLALHHMDFSPDPVDIRQFQLGDIHRPQPGGSPKHYDPLITLSHGSGCIYLAYDGGKFFIRYIAPHWHLPRHMV